MLMQVATSATWYAQGLQGALQGAFATTVPTLLPMALRLGQPPTAVLAAGAYSAALLSEHGHVLHRLMLPVRPALFSCQRLPAAL